MIKQQIKAKKQEDETEEQLIARYALMPEMSAAVTQVHVMNGELFGADLDINALVDELTNQTKAIKGKDFSRVEEMLISQAHILDRLFQQLANTTFDNSSLDSPTYLISWQT